LCLLNQKRIAGTEKPIDDLYEYLEAALLKLTNDFTEVDIAFFGGSFTGIERSEMVRYLKAAKFFRQKDSRITGIRLSTRPDYISVEILDLLNEYGVTAIELGVQSMCDDVLKLSKRSHTAEQTIKAVHIIKDYPFKFELILQMMPGLPGDNEEKINKTAEEIIRLKPEGVRIYPCVVIKETELENMYLKGQYIPLSVEKAVEISAKLTLLFKENHIKILRTGLHSSDIVRSGSVVAGPFHPAFGEMVSQYIYLQRAAGNIEKLDLNNNIKCIDIVVSKGCISKMVGQKRQNISYLENKYNIKIKVSESSSVDDDELDIRIKS
jgi:histone acetyltransferase (RNA polymerase elongator complex component)